MISRPHFAAADDKTPETRSKVGVGETVEFRRGGFDEGRTGDWSATAGKPLAATALETFTWTTPEESGTVTITATDPTYGTACSSEMQVVWPAGLDLKNIGEDTFPTGKKGAGMTIEVGFPPDEVCFHNLQWRELPGPASNVSGYFKRLQKSGVEMRHNPNADPSRISESNTDYDHAWAGPLPDDWSPGTYDWVIPNEVTMIGGSGDGMIVATTTQSVKIAEDGTVTITKGGASVTR